MGKLFDDLTNKSDEFLYPFLGRLQADCEYYLGYGYRNAKQLWANDEFRHIELMKDVWNHFDEKPEWLTWEEILSYEEQMLG